MPGSRVRETAPAVVDREQADPEAAKEVHALVVATWAVAARVGSIEPSVRDILEQAGLSTKAFYRHFRSKDELLRTAYDQGTQLLVDYLEHRMSGYEDPFDRIGEWIEGFIRQATPPAARRTLPWSLAMGRLAIRFPDDFDRNQAAIVTLLAREIRRAVTDGIGHSPDPERDAWLIFGYTVDTVRRHLIHDTAPDQTIVEALVDFACRALGRAPAAG